MNKLVCILVALCLVPLANAQLGESVEISPLNISCGNDNCEPGENIYNCAVDCSQLSFNYRTNLVNPSVNPGTTNIYSFGITNLLSIFIVPRFQVRGDIADFMELSRDTVSVGPYGEEGIEITLSVPGTQPPGVFTGELVVKEEKSRDVVLPVRLTILSAVGIAPAIEVSALTKKIDVKEPLRIQQEIYTYETIPAIIDVNYKLIRTSDSFVLYDEMEAVDVNAAFFSIKDINLTIPEGADITGDYFVEVSMTYKGTSVTATDTFKVLKVFWTPLKRRIAFIVVLVLVSAVLVIFSVNKYRVWKKSKMRYIFPNYDLLPGDTERNFWIGQVAETKRKAFYDPKDLTTHMLVAGSTGSGKSVCASVFVEEALLHNIPVVIFDPTAQWTGFVKACNDPNLIKYYGQFGYKPEDARPFKGLLYKVEGPDVVIDFKKYMNPGEVTVFNLQGLKAGDYDVAVKNIIDTMFKVRWEESPDLKLVVVFDEVHRLLEKYGGTGGYKALEKACREFRKWGLGLVMASQVSADFKEAVAGNILTEVQLNTKSMEDISKIATKYGTEFSQRVTRQGIGVAMMQNPKYNNGKPWFVQVRPTLHSPHKISEEDLKLYTDYSAELSKVEAQMEAAKKKGKDISDIELELKLASGKLKEGHFKMAEIYIDSLKESILKL